MKKRFKSFIFITLFVLSLSNLSQAQDYLYLCGKVLEKKATTIIIEVFSEDCEGKKTFAIQNPKFSPNPGQLICFTINQSFCPDKKAALILQWHLLKGKRE